MRKVYTTGKIDDCSCHCRIGRWLVKFDFKCGVYSTDNELMQWAIESSPLFMNGIIS